MNGTQPRYSPAGRKMERAQCHHVLGYTSNSKVSLGFQDWKGLKSHQVQSSASRLTHRLPTAPKNQIPHELSTTRHWKVPSIQHLTPPSLNLLICPTSMPLLMLFSLLLCHPLSFQSI